MLEYIFSVSRKSTIGWTCLFFIFGSSVLYAVVLSYFGVFFIIINNEQLLYAYSMIGQIIAGIFGLMLTAYTFYIGNIMKFSEKDDANGETIDAIVDLKRICYSHIKSISSISLLSISACYLCIHAVEHVSGSSYYNLMVNGLGMLFLLTLAYIFSFSAYFLDPNAIDRIKTQRAKIIEDEAVSVQGDKNTANLGQFIEKYNFLYGKIEKLAKMYIKNEFQYNRTGIITYLKILLEHELIDKSMFLQIDEIRQFRNAVVHGVKMQNEINKIPYHFIEMMNDICNHIEKRLQYIESHNG